MSNGNAQRFIKCQDLIYFIVQENGWVKTTKKHSVSRVLRSKNEKEKDLVLAPEQQKDDPPSESATSSQNQNPSPTLEASHESEGLTCPNEKCGKVIFEPLEMTDLSKTPKETFYVCPHCMAKLDINTLEQKSTPDPISVENPKVDKRAGSQKCPHYLGYLKERPKDTAVPDECLTCPKMIKCLPS